MRSIVCSPTQSCRSSHFLRDHLWLVHHHTRPIPGGLPQGLDVRARRWRASPRGEEGDQLDVGVGNGDEGERLLLVERCKDGSSKRYILDKKLQLQMFREDYEPIIKKIDEKTAELTWLPDFFKEIILPAGFPDSVSEDYLDYIMLQFYTNVTGWVCHTLVTSSLLQAVGIGTFSGATAAASAAAIRWVSKDGLGAVGRLLIGGRFGKIFDDDPKQWRMYADFVGSTGSIFELCTPVYPEYFLLLASLGNFAKAIARGLKDPSFRVIQNHFAISGNLGEVAAKEEVWEVAAQLLGLALGILLLARPSSNRYEYLSISSVISKNYIVFPQNTPGLQKSYFDVALIWFGVRMLHLWLRYLSLSSLRFPTVNLKRARILVKSHVLQNTVPGYLACNKEEDILSWERLLHPRIIYGASIKTIMSTGNFEEVEPLLKLYCKERYILVFSETQRGQLEFIITFKVGATSMSVLRSLWQTHWLDKHWGETARGIFHTVQESLLRLEGSFDDFLGKLEEAGWSLDAINLKVPKDVLFEDTAHSIESNSDR